MEFVPVLVMLAAVKKIVDFIKYLRAGDVNAVLTQVLAWAAGVGILIVASHSDYGHLIAINGTTLADLNVWSLVFVGFNVASAAGLFTDTVKAVDNSQSAVVPNLVDPVNAPSAHTRGGPPQRSPPTS